MTVPAGVEVREQPYGVRPALVALLLAMLLATLDNLILSAAMPTVISELDGLALLAWVVTSYTLAMAVTTPLWGKFGDMYGRKGVFALSIVVFLVGSALAGAAGSIEQLVVFRAVQGVGAGGLMVGALAIIADIVPPRERGRYQGMMSMVMGVAMIGGPIAGGFVTDVLGWRWAFFVNIPLGLVALVLTFTMLDLPKRRPALARIDYLGAVTLAVAISAVVLVTTWGGREIPWTSPEALGLIALAVAGTVAFVLVERRAAEPVIPLSVFRNRNFSLITVVGFAFGFGMTSVLTVVPLFQQAVQGASPTSSGFLLLPVFGALVVTNVVVGRYMSRTGRYRPVVVLGTVLILAGLALLATMGVGTGFWLSAVYLAIFGVGMGSMMQTTVLISLTSVDPQHIGVASASATLFRSIGGAVGVAVMGAVFADRVQAVVSERIGPAGGVEAGSVQLDAASLQAVSEPVRAAYEHAVAAGSVLVFLLCIIAAVAALAAAVFIREVPLPGGTEPANRGE